MASQNPTPIAISPAPLLAPATSKPEATTVPVATINPAKTTIQNNPPPPKKRTSTGTDSSAPAKVTKRRAARACVSCRARKVRCDVVEGAPCGNCRWDNVECVVQESRRRKKNIHQLTANAVAARHMSVSSASEAQAKPTSGVGSNPIPITSSAPLHLGPDAAASLNPNAGNAGSFLGAGLGGAFPNLPYQQSGYGNITDENSRRLLTSLLNQVALFGGNNQFLTNPDELDVNTLLPPFIRPFPSKVSAQDVKFLREKGALSLPNAPLQNALLQAYAEYVHPYMPLLDMQEFLGIINAGDGSRGQLSLFLYQAVLFAATAFVDMKHLREAGYATRKAARKAFFQRTRLLYDFDYEADRVILVQGLLLKTFWYESPDDQKDTWHWMGVAISLAHTIGLHRNPMASNMPTRKQKLWKRIWWSCFMRDRLIALGMRRPTRIKDEDFDVPMLEKGDFDIECLAEDNTTVSADCAVMRDLSVQEDLAELCIAKAQLCILISRMLKAQYSVLARDKVAPDNTTHSTMMLLPNKANNVEMVKTVDLDLISWESALPEACQYRPLTPLDVRDGKSTVAVHRTLLHMVYHTTVSALHRPQFLPASPVHALIASRPVQEMARIRVRDAAARITLMAADLHRYRLERYLPTTGVTVVLPAMIIHLLDMKNPISQTRERAIRGFKQCMKVMEKLRDIYAAADYAAGFLDAALRKASIDLSAPTPVTVVPPSSKYSAQGVSAQTPPPDNAPYMTTPEASLYTANYSQEQPTTTFTPPATMATPLAVSAASPPHTERDLDSTAYEMTPSASGSSEEMSLDYDLIQNAGTNGIVGTGEGNWNADVDMDQWLQFPPEGVNNSDDTFMAGMFNDEGAAQLVSEQTLSWTTNFSTESASLEQPTIGPTDMTVQL
ncbi:hypothetical protein jhhlp_002599 [Lomentospora prolificans]|uniref:Zn(2)-C6 fungal-type domain-containing protein n=1 Tax=Lomentospora prolificans TaxID=41688 RepID=A0A2N3NEQ2_9PEZI|nr:hypothetical protein jhhlp_002599 [Lomentospora prolificans]